MWSYGFFNSVNGDRTYNAQQMSEIFEGLITDGVYEAVGNKLAVQANSGMTIQIATGRGWFNKRWVNNDTEYLMSLEASDVTLNRYCAVCVRVDESDSGRTATPYLKYSEFATTPVKPTMTRTETIKEYCLAYVLIRAGASEITAADIEDTRANTELCGWVTGLIKQLDATTLFEQYKAIFFDWFNNLEEYMDENVEAKLVNDVLELQGRNLKTTVSLIGSDWVENSDGTYSQTVYANGVTAASDIMVSPKNEDVSTYVAMGCEATATGTHSITFECTNPQSVDVMVEVIIFNIGSLADIVMESVTEFSVTDDGNGNVTITA